MENCCNLTLRSDKHRLLPEPAAPAVKSKLSLYPSLASFDSWVVQIQRQISWRNMYHSQWLRLFFTAFAVGLLYTLDYHLLVLFLSFLVRTGSRSPEVSRTGSPLFPQLAGRNPRQVAKSATGVPKTWGVTREARVEGNLIGAWRTLLFLPFISTPKENTHMVVPLSANQRKQLTHEDPSLLLFKIRVNRTTKLLTAGCS